MSFANQIQQFVDKAKAEVETKAKEYAYNQLRHILGDDVQLIKPGIRFDADAGKFSNVDAPDFVIEKLRQAGVLKEA